MKPSTEHLRKMEAFLESVMCDIVAVHHRIQVVAEWDECSQAIDLTFGFHEVNADYATIVLRRCVTNAAECNQKLSEMEDQLEENYNELNAAIASGQYPQVMALTESHNEDSLQFTHGGHLLHDQCPMCGDFGGTETWFGHRWHPACKLITEREMYDVERRFYTRSTSESTQERNGKILS